ncbi:hypothetical protein [Qipengyuania gaetbuli]
MAVYAIETAESCNYVPGETDGFDLAWQQKKTTGSGVEDPEGRRPDVLNQ